MSPPMFPPPAWGALLGPRGAEAEVSFQQPGSISQETSTKANVGHGATWVPDLLLRIGTDHWLPQVIVRAPAFSACYP